MSEQDQDGVSRRDVMKAGTFATAGLIGMGSMSDANAQTSGPRVQLGDEWEFDDKSDGSIELVNASSGARLAYDESTGSWSVGSLHAEEGRITQRHVLDRSQNNPFHPRSPEFSGSYSLRPHQEFSDPLLTASDINSDDPDISDATFVADPFWIHEPADGLLHIWYEVKRSTGDKDIGYATWRGQPGTRPTHHRRVLTGLFAYPLVQRVGDELYMTPDTQATGTRDFEIYTVSSLDAQKSGENWSLVERPLSDIGSDPTMFAVPEGDTVRWYNIQGYTGQQGTYLFAADSTGEDPTGRSWSQVTQLFASGNSEGVHGPGGRADPRPDGTVYLPMQKDGTGGTKLVRLTDLSPTNAPTVSVVSERLTTKSKQVDSWNYKDMHHVDLLKPDASGEAIALVDGLDQNDEWTIAAWTMTDGLATEFRYYDATQGNSIPGDGTWSSVYFTDSTYDYANAFGSNGFNAPTSGLYELRTRAGWVGGAPSSAQIRIRNQTTGSVLAQSDTGETGIETRQRLNAGDLVRVDVAQSSGSSIEYVADETQTYIEGRRVR